MPAVTIPDSRRERGAVLLRDPLSEVARKERRALLLVSAAGYVVVKTGLVPSKIEALGITFSAKEQGALLTVFALVVMYFVVTFVLYAAIDALAFAWAIFLAKQQLADEVDEVVAARVRRAEAPVAEPAPRPPFVKRGRFKFRRVTLYVALLRDLWDFVFPVVAGVVVVVLLLRAR
jgi:hypothetical protein